MAEKSYTARQIAERYDVAASTVRGWLLRGLLPGAVLKETALGSYWEVPESALAKFEPPRPGPVPKGASSNGKAAAKKTAKKGGKR